jgi:lycopene beta-cyclase
VRLQQHFAGRFIETQEPAFDPGAVTLMDFDVPEPGPHFAYVLPFDERHALVEDTWMTAEPHPPAVYERCLDVYIRERLGLAEHRVLGTEAGVIPMTTEDVTPHHSVRVIPIGLRGGLARPSTGYAFLAIQRHARELARRVVSTELPEPPPVRPSYQQFMDRVFLNVLEQQSHEAGALFLRLFKGSEPDTLVRFLSEVGSVRDLLSVMTTLRSVSFTREAVRQIARAV